MSSRARNFRRRADDGDNDDNDANGATTITATAASASFSKPSSKAAPSITKPKKSHQKLLSFADDEESETPISRPSSKSSASRLSRPSSSHKMTSVKDRLAPSPASVPSNVQPQAGQYTKEALRELQKNTKTLASSRGALDPKPSPAAEPVIVLKGLVRPVLESEKDVEDGLEEERESVERDSARREHDDAERRLGLLGIEKGREGDGLGSVIPDQAMINAIRAKRERLRKSRTAAVDYISLDGGSNHGAAEGLSDEEPEFQTRIAMLGDKTDGGARKGVFEDFDERPVRGAQLRVEVDDEDEEERKWEEEQFRKGLGKRMDDGPSRVSSNSTLIQSTQLPELLYPAPAAVGPPSVEGAFGGLQGFEVMPIAQQAEIARKALQDSVKRLKETHGKTMNSLTRADDNLSTALANIIDYEYKLSAAGEKFVFMQKLRDFVSVICDFLQHKAPYIEELEEQMQQLHKERATAILERRAADNDDELSEVNAALSVFSKGGASVSTIPAAAKAAQAAVAALKEHRLPVELDEMGRDLNLKKRMDMARRAEARQRRKARSDSKRMSSIANDSSYQRIEGESSTDDSDDESAAYQSHRELLLQTAEQVFSDAAEEYSQLSAVKERFDRWKRYYSSNYRDAYMSLSIPAIFSPYVRLELLKWDPLHEEVDFYDMKWHSLLFDYGVPQDGNDFSPDDADADLVPGLVEKIALPILHHDIAHCWDMLSTRETKNAVSATSLVVNYVPASSEALKELIAAIHARLADAVTNLEVPTWSALVLKAVPIAARFAAYRFGVAVRLMRNICLWKDILALPVLENLALDQLLAGKILPHVRTLKSDVHDAIARTERVIDSLSGVWAGPSVTGTRSHKLQLLVDYVLMLGKALEKRHSSGMAETETSGLARRLKKMLVELNEYDEARALSRTFHLKEAL
ncbi:hypothetical protein Nepgr_012746 [Nepenthes gracilis]|uniref:GCF C-terminal domain-containing protein n=1 Tax=Nepenthes gracilis TaxID=150966 RepID=A0AAD3XNM7_NEPGR|nr:hypothetical protein Nepgr_012746 [Nepenthes gracilis]